MQTKLEPAEQRALYAKLGETITDPKALSQWRRDPKRYHAEHKSNKAGTGKAGDYDEDQFNEMLRRYDRQPEIQMQNVFTDLVQQAEAAYRTTLGMSRAVFALGILIVAVTFVVEVAYILNLIPGAHWEQALAGGGILGGLGVGSIVTVFVRGPSRQVENAIGDLAQIEIAFLSFIDQTRGLDFSLAKTLDDNERLVNLISKLRREAMDDIQTYLEKPDLEPQSNKK
jgi:hypothetical protein